MTVYCNNCGTEGIDGESFCSSCGNELPATNNPGKYANLGNYQAQAAPAVIGATVWTGGSLLDAVKAIYVSPAENAKSLIEDPNAPNPNILVIVVMVFSAIASIISGMKTKIVFEQEGMESATSIISFFFSPVFLGTVTVLGLLLSWWLGSLILGALIKGGLPMNSYSRYNVSKSMMRLNAYRLASSLIILIPQSILYLISPENVITIRADGTQVASGYPATITIILFIFALISAIASLYLLYTGITALQYEGVWLYIVLAILAMINYSSLSQAYFPK